MAFDPLDQIPSLTPHPLSGSSPSLSYIIEDLEAFIPLQDETSKRLQTYHSVNNEDNTIVFLQAFLDFLSERGRMALMSDITSLSSDENLRALRLHLIDAILKPSK